MMNPAEFTNLERFERDLWWFRGMERTLYRFLDPHIERDRPLDVLEAGCGTGHMSRRLADRYGWRMFPSDLSAVGLAHARSGGLTRLTQLDMRALPFRQASFDAVFSLDVIAHLDPGEEGAVFQDFARVLRPGGLLIVRTSALDILRSRHSEFVGERQRLTKRRLIDACENAGLRVERVTYLNSLLLPVALAKFRLWEPLTNAPPASGVAMPSPWLNRMLEWPLRVESALIGTGWNFPLGQSLLAAAWKAK